MSISSWPASAQRVSNCLFGRRGRPSFEPASRLALRATARSAAAALTRPVRWARGSSYGRHGMPTGIAAIHPIGTVPEHGVQDCDDIAHDGDHSDLRSFAGGDETA